MSILHITFSLATQGSMKLAIRQHRLQRNESVLSVHDDLSIGPLQNFEERKAWLAAHILTMMTSNCMMRCMKTGRRKLLIYPVMWMCGFGIVTTHMNK